MTCRERLKIEHPERCGDEYHLGVAGCPSIYGYLDDPDEGCGNANCNACWDREIPVEENKPHILDSGTRREFETGAVRDIQEGKGRCDLLPLDVVCHVYLGKSSHGGRGLVLGSIYDFINTNKTVHLIDALEHFLLHDNPWDCNWSTMFLETAKQFEDGAKKYGEDNWQKGIPTHCYIDSAVRHYLKWLRGDKDEPHDRAFCWNILCCIWTCIHKPELNDYAKKGLSE